MRITDIEAIVVRQDKVCLIGDGTQDTALIRVHTDEGISGIGEVDSAPYVVKAIIDMPASHSASMGLKEVVLGRDPFDIEPIWHDMYERSYYHGRGSAALHAMSGIDMALWDICGKATGKPVSKLLGGCYRSKVPAYISILMPETEDEVKRLVDHHMKEGYSGIKFGWGRLGESPEHDRRMVKAARKALGEEPLLMIDIAMMWERYKDALSLCREFADLGVNWVEEPFRMERPDDYQRLRAEAPLYITAGEELGRVDEFKAFLEGGLVDIIQPDISRCGGLTSARRIAQMAEAAGIPVIPHNFKSGILMSATLQYIAALKSALYLEYCGQETVLSKNLVMRPTCVGADGTVEIPELPGLGIEINEETLKRYRVL